MDFTLDALSKQSIENIIREMICEILNVEIEKISSFINMNLQGYRICFKDGNILILIYENIMPLADWYITLIYDLRHFKGAIQ